MNSLYKGKILISTPDTSGDIFSRSVILIIEHNDEGAFGLILNKKNEPISNKLSQLFDFKTDIYNGGPVSKERMFFIINSDDKLLCEYYLPIDNGFYLTEDSKSVISNIMSKKLSPENIKIFIGYSGWESGQLEKEISLKYWTIIDNYDINYFSYQEQNMWKKLMQNLGGQHLIWANTPDDVSWN